jgi:DNA-binding transcriptional MerR regulator
MTEPIESTSDDALLPMREVASLTGVNPITLRAWERRHGLIRPVRTVGGHRLYSQQDIEHIRSIMLWTSRGLPISKIGALLVRQQDTPGITASGSAEAPLVQWQEAVHRAAQAFDGAELERLHGQLFTIYPKATVLEAILLPVWRSLASGNNFGRRSQWLFLDAFLRARMLLRLQMNQSNGACVLLADGSGHARELELLCAGLLMSSDQLRIEVLGAGQLLDELPLLCEAIQPAALVLLVQAPLQADAHKRLRALQMGVTCPVALAGDGAAASSEELRGSSIAILGKDEASILPRLEALVRGTLQI